MVTNFIKALDDQSRLGMVLFDQKATLVEELAGLTDDTVNARFLENLEKVNYKGKLTDSPAGVERAIYELKTDGRKNARKVIIFLTDGIVDTGDKSKDREKSKWLKEVLTLECQRADIRIFSVGFTDNADFSLIQTLAFKTDGKYYRAYKAEDIATVFKKITEVLTTPAVQTETPIPEPQVTPEAQLATPSPSLTVQPSRNNDDASIKKATPVTPQPKKTEVQPDATAIPTPRVSTPLNDIQIWLLILASVIILLIKGRSAKIEPQSEGDLKSMPGPVTQTLFFPEAELVDINRTIFDAPMPLMKYSTEIGRLAGRDIIIEKDTVSGLHATIDFHVFIS